LINQV